jgi:hypothetical protein
MHSTLADFYFRPHFSLPSLPSLCVLRSVIYHRDAQNVVRQWLVHGLGGKVSEAWASSESGFFVKLHDPGDYTKVKAL